MISSAAIAHQPRPTPALTGVVFNVQRFSLHDGPGIRTTVFLKGCPLECAWCHNPESRAHQPEIVRLSQRCIRCGHCTDEELADPVVHDKDRSDIDQCPSGALQMVGEVMEVAHLVQTVERDRVFFDRSGGGVTFSGGEPLAQAAFVTEAMRRLRAAGIHTALDTCGLAPWAHLRDAAEQADLILFDLKLIDAQRHAAVTGAPSERIHRNLVALANIHHQIRIRIPVIPGVNDDDVNLRATAEFVASLPGVRHVDLLPYHPTGAPKYARTGLTYAMGGTATPDDDQLRAAAGIFHERSLTTTIGGVA